nr:hypothetical protein [Tanacetum cinerariifolium]
MGAGDVRTLAPVRVVLQFHRFASLSKWRVWKVRPAKNEAGLAKVKPLVDGKTYGNRSSTGSEKVMTGCIILGTSPCYSYLGNVSQHRLPISDFQRRP